MDCNELRRNVTNCDRLRRIVADYGGLRRIVTDYGELLNCEIRHDVSDRVYYE